MTIRELKKQRDRKVFAQQREYQRWGNTQRCQELWVEIQSIEEQIRNTDEQIKERRTK